MGFFDKFNGATTVRPEVGDITDWPFMPLKDYIGGAIKVDGYFFTNGRYGRQVVVVGNGAKINMPGYAVKNFEAINEDKEAVEKMLAGEMAITDIEPLETKNGQTTGFRICDAADLEDGEPVPAA
jgi:hypothetical protein